MHWQVDFSTGFLLLFVGWVWSLKLTSTVVPYYAVLHGEDTLLCHFDLENDKLFALKWYKDGHEFFRFKPRDIPPITFFPVDGVFVSENRSTIHRVQLERITMASMGEYRCEVSADAPHFQTVYKEKHMKIMVVPPEGPMISNIYPWYNVGDNLTAQCNYNNTFPEAKLTWFINNAQIDSQECGCVTFDASFANQLEDTTLYNSTTQIKFPIDTNYFRDGIISIECRATFNHSSVFLKDIVFPKVKSGLGLQYAMHSGNYAFRVSQQIVFILSSLYLTYHHL